jgi:hypothetical protein
MVDLAAQILEYPFAMVILLKNSYCLQKTTRNP